MRILLLTFLISNTLLAQQPQNISAKSLRFSTVPTFQAWTNDSSVLLVNRTSGKTFRTSLPAPSLQQVLSAGSSLTSSHNITGGGNSLILQNFSSVNQSATTSIDYWWAGSSRQYGLNASSSGAKLWAVHVSKETSLKVHPDSLVVKLATGTAYVDSLNRASGILNKHVMLYDTITKKWERITMDSLVKWKTGSTGIYYSGAVGINISAPETDFHVVGTQKITAPGIGSITLGNTFSDEIGLMDSVDNVIAVAYNGSFNYGGGQPGAAVITAVGTSVGINNPSPVSALDIIGDVKASGEIFFQTDGEVLLGNRDGGNTYIRLLGNNATDAILYSATNGHSFDGSGVKMSMFGAGTATFDASGNLSSASDERLKNIHSTYQVGLSALRQIKPIVFSWNDKSGLETAHSYIGFSAQNIHAALGTGATGVDQAGYLSIQDRAIMAVLVNAVNELSDKVTRLENELKTSRARDRK